MSNLVTRFPGLAQLTTIGTSVEGRSIRAIKISENLAADDPNDADVIFVAAHHAREWISVEMALYLAEYLLKNYSTDAALQTDMNRLRIWIVPIVNPDGFVYTWASPANRYWRKNRRNNGDGTFGVDLNRNWSYQWGLNSGSSPSTTDDTYRGPSPFSEPEIVAVRNLAQSVANLKFLISYHSFSELFLRPWGYTTADPPGEPTLQSIVTRNISAISTVHGHVYGPTIGYTASGETTDWLWGEMRVAAFTPELRPSPTGLGGFAPPPSEIIPNNEENIPPARALIHDAAAKEVWIRDHAADTGVEPSAVWTSSGWSHAFWESPDIWTVPTNLVEGGTVTMNVRILNDTSTTKNNVQVGVFYTDPRVSLEFPNPGTILIGSQTVNVPPGGITITMPWAVPTGTNIWGERHWCVGAIIKHDTDMPLTTQAQRTSNIGIRNFQTTEMLVGNNILVAATNFLDVAAELRVVVDKQSIPVGWNVFIPPQLKKATGARLRGIDRKALLLDVTGPLLEPGESITIPIRVEPPLNAKAGTTVDIKVSGALFPLVTGKRIPVGNGYTYRLVVPECPSGCVR